MSDLKKTQKILIIKPSALGDIALALPTLASVRQSFPNAEISWLVRKEYAPLLEMAGDLDKIIIFDRKHLGKWYKNPKAFAELFRFFRTLHSKDFDIVVDLQGLFRTALFSRITGCKKRYGMKNAREFAGMFYTHKAPLPQKGIHMIEIINSVLSHAGAEKLFTDYELKIDDQTLASTNKLLTENGCTGKYAVFVTGAAHANKCWPPEKFAEIADRFKDQFALSIVAVGTKMDKPVIEKLKAQAKTEIIDLTAKTNIKVLTALMSKASIVITNDTGPGQIAIATFAPVIMIFGPTNPLRVGPYKKPLSIAAVDAYTRGSDIESSDPKHTIEKVTTQSVFHKAKSLLNHQT